jgi:hypothetical protein
MRRSRKQDAGKTIAWRIRTFRFDHESERCTAFAECEVCRNLFLSTLPFLTTSIRIAAFRKEFISSLPETIYRSLYIQARGVLKKELLGHLRAKRTVRRSKHASLKRNGLGQIKNAISISERPASVEDRAVPGHHCPAGDCKAITERGEGDLIGGSKNSYVVRFQLIDATH